MCPAPYLSQSFLVIEFLLLLLHVKANVNDHTGKKDCPHFIYLDMYKLGREISSLLSGGAGREKNPSAAAAARGQTLQRRATVVGGNGMWRASWEASWHAVWDDQRAVRQCINRDWDSPSNPCHMVALLPSSFAC